MIPIVQPYCKIKNPFVVRYSAVVIKKVHIIICATSLNKACNSRLMKSIYDDWAKNRPIIALLP